MADANKYELENFDPVIAAGKRNLDLADFDGQKLSIINLLTDLTSDIRERNRMKREKTSHPLAHVRLATRLGARTRVTREELDVLAKILIKINSSKKLKAKYTEADLQAFHTTLNNLEEQFATCEAAIHYKSIESTRKHRVNFDLTEPEGAKPVTREDEHLATESIRKWRQRDIEFDQQLQEIGETVDRIGMVASEICERASKQAGAAIDAVTKVQDTTMEISAVSYRIKKLLKRQRRIECTIRMVLILVLLVMLSLFIFALLSFIKGTNRIRGGYYGNLA